MYFHPISPLWLHLFTSKMFFSPSLVKITKKFHEFFPHTGRKGVRRFHGNFFIWNFVAFKIDRFWIPQSLVLTKLTISFKIDWFLANYGDFFRRKQLILDQKLSFWMIWFFSHSCPTLVHTAACFPNLGSARD